MTATVYIWYPNFDDGHIGHASMHIGPHDDAHSTTNYVSWWPLRGAGLTHPTAMKTLGTLAGDCDSEGSLPHAKYTFKPSAKLQVNEMKWAWEMTWRKPGAHYKLWQKNCSTIVARILRAGGADALLNPLEQASYAHNLFWTPKDLAQWCNKLRDKGHVDKQKGSQCPVKGGVNRVFMAMGLR